MCFRVFLGAIVLLAWGTGAAAQPAPTIAVVLTSDSTRVDVRHTKAWIDRMTRAAEREHAHVTLDVERWVVQAGAAGGDTTRAHVLALAEVERLLLAAREHAASLRESEALQLLARALVIAEAHADVPGASTWIAEVHLAIGLVAAQAGLEPLVSSAIHHAVTLDPTRAVRAAETNPQMLERSSAIARQVSSGPTGTFVVDADVAGATVYLDDVELGTAPRRVRTSVGRHALRVSASGTEPWGGVIDVLEGERPSYRVRLAPSPASIAARGLVHAARSSDFAATRIAMERLDALHVSPASVWIVELAASAGDRALVIACDADGCGEPVRAIAQRPLRWPSSETSVHGHALEARVADARAWLYAADAPTRHDAPKEWWERWYVWTAVGIGAAAAIASAALLLEPEREDRFRAIIDLGELGSEDTAAVH